MSQRHQHATAAANHAKLTLPHDASQIFMRQNQPITALTTKRINRLQRSALETQESPDASRASPTRNQKPETRNQKPETRNQKPETRNQKRLHHTHPSPPGFMRNSNTATPALIQGCAHRQHSDAKIAQRLILK